MFYLLGNFRTSSPGGSISSNPERTAVKRWGEEPCYVELLQWRAGSLNVKRWLLIKENQISQVKEFRSFLLWEDARVWAHWSHSFDMHLSYLGPVFCVFTSWVFSGLFVGSGCSQMAVRWHVFCPSWVPSGLTGSPLAVGAAADECDTLFSDTAGSIPFVKGRLLKLSWGMRKW